MFYLQSVTRHIWPWYIFGIREKIISSLKKKKTWTYLCEWMHQSIRDKQIVSRCLAFCSVNWPSCYFHQFLELISRMHLWHYVWKNKQMYRIFLFHLRFERLFGFSGNTCTCLDNWPNKVPPNRGQLTRYILIVHISIRGVEVWSSTNDVQRVIFYLYSVISHSTIPTMRCVSLPSLFASLFPCVVLGENFENPRVFRLFALLVSCSWIVTHSSRAILTGLQI